MHYPDIPVVMKTQCAGCTMRHVVCGGKYYARVITSLTYKVKSMTNGDNIPGYNFTATHIDYVQEVAKLHIAQLSCPSGDTSKGSKHHLCYCPLQVKLVLARSKNTW
jgi:hypothetical protein